MSEDAKPEVLHCECGKKSDPDNYADCVESRLMRKHSLCFTCAFWTHIADHDAKGDKKSLVVDGVHYHIAPEKKEQYGFRGFGGQRFKILFNDGRCAESTNLWCQGSVPDRFRDRLPDNAVFEKDQR